MTIQDTRVPTAVVSTLALTQIIGYGTLYYSFSIVAPLISHDIGISIEIIFAIYTLALFASGATAPMLGRMMDKHGAALVMSAGSLAAAVTLAAGSLTSNIYSFGLLTILMQIAGGMMQYQAAFTTLVETNPHSAGRSITFLTLFAGFSSTLFWPFATYLTAHFSWQEIYLLYAALNFFTCLPLHIWIARRSRKASSNSRSVPEPVIGRVPVNQRRLVQIVVAIAFGLQGFTLSAILTHMVPMLTAVGLGSLAVTIGILFGPSQALSRVATMLFNRYLTPITLAALSSILMVTATSVLAYSGDWLPGAVVFALCLGLGSGISSIAQGALPLWLFGSKGYGEISGRISAARLVAASTAPFIFSLMMEKLGTSLALALNSLLGFGGIVAFIIVARLAKNEPRDASLNQTQT
jgi:MFS family permease